MRFWSGFGAVAGCLLLGSFASAATATITHDGTSVDMDFVTIGDAGNEPDDATGYGAVDYTYQIGTYEVSENQWDAVVGAKTDDLLNDDGYWSDNQPVAGISWYDAAMFCNWLTSGDVLSGVYQFDDDGNFLGIDRSAACDTIYYLPTEDEWYKAAYYDPETDSYSTYPTGSDTVPDGIDSSDDTAFDAVFWDGYSQGAPNDVDKAGVLSAYGTMGQGGNVWEWMESTISETSMWHVMRGGSFYGSSRYMASSNRGGVYPADSAYTLGFRVASNSVAAVPEPGSLIIWACGSLGAFVLRRRRR